jgi:hypothetical protein
MATTTAEATSYLDEPPAYDFNDLSTADQKELFGEVRSVNSSNTELTQSPTDFAPSKTLLVNTRGIRLIRFPIPPGELEIPITTPDGNIVYLSSRAKRWEGNSILSDADGKELLASEYKFGPGREPKLQMLDQEGDKRTVFTKGKWTSRKQEFVLPNGQTFTWGHVRELDNTIRPKKQTYLVLEVPLSRELAPTGKGKMKSETRRVAQLVRGEEARTPGTRSSDAGNGGELKFDGEAVTTFGLREDVVVATCLMMLKKEVDRRRLVQFMVMAAAAGGA